MPSDPREPGHEGSITSQDHAHEDTPKVKNRKPANTAFRQQRLKAWQPILTPKTVLPLFFVIGIIFAPIGGLLLYASAQVQELIIDYSNCATQAPDVSYSGDYDTMSSSLVTSHFKSNSSNPSPATPKWGRRAFTYNYYNNSKVVQSVNATQCTLEFTLPNEMKPPVLFYYKLTNFYQNHRRYAKSFNTDQLSGTAISADSADGSDCSPLTSTNEKPYYPCGLVANSIFNDTFSNPVLLNVPGSSITDQVYTMKNNSGIAWSSDADLYGTTKYAWADVAVPPNWVEKYGEEYTDDWHIDVVNDEALHVWMRLAGLPTFSKLAQRNDDDIMVAGTYRLNITMLFPVTEYGGTKSVLISTRTVMGGKNSFLGIAYVVVAGLCVLLGTVFLVTHLIKPRKLGDHTYLSWNNEAPSQAAGGREGAGGDDHR
ncbi:ligand-effect modulator 3 family [Calycina marina]|uniref:Ligand-effect modulator 3 family n=1 Tax=Calycina marina TaxID=1763456 RepID=A0A9P7Z022_9HELO|nr:ligand-effect modulator 3 family [Calycina marina]